MATQNLMSAKKEEKGKNIQVVVRCRPFNMAERKVNSHSVLECEPARKEVAVRIAGINEKLGKKTYTFDMVFGPQAKQIDVYRSVVCPILDEVIMGYNCTVFAYGQTGTGKTFTMEGERSPDAEFTWEEDPLAGIIPRTLHQIFEKLSENGTEFSVKVSLLEIYNEELFDLLSPSPDVNERLQMFDDPRNKRGVIIKGLEEITVHNKDEVYHILERGAAKRTTASTLMNAYSSRSHSVFSVTIHMKETTLDGEELVKIGKLNLVDLAGSENIGRSGAVDKRAREAGNINQSLLTLGRVITALVERAPHIPYRESKLTRILQDSLGGRTKTSIIATVSPASINMEETLSTLEYAHRAKNIMNKPEVNQKLTKRALIKEYTEEIERLKRDLAASREKNGVYLSTENYDLMYGKLASQEEQIADYTERISAMEDELKRVTELFTESKKELDDCSSVLQNTERELERTHNDLQDSRLQLAQEEYVVATLETNERKLHTTANKLLGTVVETTRDVSGLHEKLDRKQAVDKYNVDVQVTFAEQMNKIFNKLQDTVVEYNLKQRGMLDFYTTSVGDLLSANSSASAVAASAVVALFASVKETVCSDVSQGLNEILKQESVSAETKENLQKLMEDHRFGLERAFRNQFLPIVVSVLDLNSHLKQNMQSFSALADKMEDHKEEMNVFFTNHSVHLNSLWKDSVSQLAALQSEYENVREELKEAERIHSEDMAKIISSLQNQLNSLTSKTRENFSSILMKGEKLQESYNVLQEDIQIQSTAAVASTVSQQEKFITASDNLTQEMRQLTSLNLHILEESSKQCDELSNSITAAHQEAEQWWEVANTKVICLTEQQKSYLNTRKLQLQSLEQDVDEKCSCSVAELTEHINKQRDAGHTVLTTLKDQMMDDERVIIEQKLELHAQAQLGLNKVLSFLQDELKKDFPTGMTPQRKQYLYPTVLVKTKPRDQLLEEFKRQQLDLQIPLSDATVPTEEADQDSTKDEPLMYDDNLFDEKSFVDLNVTCQESGGVPFFQHKKSQKREKENKATTTLLEKSKIEDGTETIPRSKLPLRLQN
ncbi:kinesin-like protein KIF11 [Rhinatrema bivittatum]|uniref:kinesin-like protein KIF11 n=1 Tax=Rhinatrema bivittatum TaxID=194408 RepID=UPI00112CE7AD|nr:kinesin-like protein KIF11 [Rhinatrema bivittatum]XP_029465779.1 kinesin-like protein KIF11 [Rhinatrema bivittatum]